MGNLLLDTAIQGLRLAGLPVPSVSFIEMLINEGEDVLSAIPRLVTTIEAMGGSWSILEDVAYGMEQYGPIGYVQHLVDQHFTPAIQVVQRPIYCLEPLLPAFSSGVYGMHSLRSQILYHILRQHLYK